MTTRLCDYILSSSLLLQHHFYHKVMETESSCSPSPKLRYQLESKASSKARRSLICYWMCPGRSPLQMQPLSCCATQLRAQCQRHRRRSQASASAMYAHTTKKRLLQIPRSKQICTMQACASWLKFGCDAC